MKIRDKSNLGAGVLFLVFGGAGMALSPGYQMGSAARMGPGYFPFLVSLCLAGIGCALVAWGLSWAKKAGSGPPIQFRAVALVLGSVMVFALLLKPLGLLLSGLVLVLLSSMAHRGWKPLESLACAALLVTLVFLLFSHALGMHLPVWPWFLNWTV
ncbi:MAG: tripartite tricarboxylate transporter TctB family protein [Thermodesulfobacteriota bacterium]